MAIIQNVVSNYNKIQNMRDSFMDSLVDGYKLQRNMNFPTSEMKALNAQFGDPLNLNFKILINYDKPYGLFADESNPNSALAFLQRNGETLRYSALKIWIAKWMDFHKNHDYLILTCEGLDAIFNHKLQDMWLENDAKIGFGIRETVDMRFQSLISVYRNIVFDVERGVKVLPDNLLRFDINVVLYSAGYYNMLVYADFIANNEAKSNILPTLQTVTENLVYNKEPVDYKFNTVVVNLGDCMINEEETGKSFFETVSNDPSNTEPVKNYLALKFRFSKTSGVFKNIYGAVDLTRMFAILASQDKAVKDTTVVGTKKNLAGRVGDALVAESKKAGTSFVKGMAKKAGKYLDGALGADSVIGNALGKITDPNFIKNMVKNTVDLGIGKLEDKYIYGNITKINNLILKNYSDNLVDLYKNYFKDEEVAKNMEYMENDKSLTLPEKRPHYSPDEVKAVQKGISYKVENIYNRGGF